MESIQFNDKRFALVRAVRVDVFESNEDIMAYRDQLHAEKVLRREDRYLFCNEMTEPEIIEGDGDGE
jgi:hypothetical protein